MASSIYGLEPDDDCQRWSKKDQVRVVVRRPAVIAMYNKSMGGVDLCDRVISYHKMETRTTRWNLRVIAHFVDLALSNCWIENRIDSQLKMQLYDFRIAVALTLVNAEVPTGTLRLSQDEAVYQLCLTVRLACHLPVIIACDLRNDARCRLEGCKGKTRMKCEKCGVFLYMSVARNCFRDFHTK